MLFTFRTDGDGEVLNDEPTAGSAGPESMAGVRVAVDIVVIAVVEVPAARGTESGAVSSGRVAGDTSIDGDAGGTAWVCTGVSFDVVQV